MPRRAADLDEAFAVIARAKCDAVIVLADVTRFQIRWHNRHKIGDVAGGWY
jgi:hypothetical protein